MTNQKLPKLKLKLPKSHATLAERKARKGWLFVLPFVLGFALVYLPIIIDSIWFTFGTLERQAIEGTTMFHNVLVPSGIDHYKTAFESAKFVTKLGQGLLELLWEVPAIVIFALFIAVMLNQKMIGRAAFRAIFFVPVIIATGLMEAVESTGSADMEGGIDDGAGEDENNIISMLDVQLLFSNMAVGGELVSFVVGLVNRIYDVVNFSGVQMLIFLAGLQSISPAIYEASRIDGASSWETFWKVTFPMISPMILVNGIYTIIDSFTRDSNVVMTMIKEQYESVARDGRHVATAEAWMYFLVVLLIIGAFAGIASAWVFYQKKDS